MLEAVHPELTPEEAFRRLKGLDNVAFLDSALGMASLGQVSYLAVSPFSIFQVEEGFANVDGKRSVEHPLIALREFLGKTTPSSSPHFEGFHGGAIGYFAYDFAAYCDVFPEYEEPKTVPDAWFGWYDIFLRFDHGSGESHLVALEGVAPDEARFANRLRSVKEALATPQPPKSYQPHQLEWRANLDKAGFENAVEDLRRRIFHGDVFQVNLTRKNVASLPPEFDAKLFYLSLRQKNPAPFAAYLDCGKTQIACSSPERFLKLEGNKVETRPIKGTIARMAEPEADARAKEKLRNSRKDVAENVMIVDLLRNDLSKISKPFSVKVPALCEIESYENLHHLVSTVTAELEEGKDAFDLIGATFPGGSITGAPKIKAMEIISELEGVRRGIYCGAIGWIGHNGDMDMNIVIRSAIFANGEAILQSGGGITWGSGAATEYVEIEVKAARIRAAFEEGSPA